MNLQRGYSLRTPDFTNIWHFLGKFYNEKDQSNNVEATNGCVAQFSTHLSHQNSLLQYFNHVETQKV